jgi:hypothetical protein
MKNKRIPKAVVGSVMKEEFHDVFAAMSSKMDELNEQKYLKRCEACVQQVLTSQDIKKEGEVRTNPLSGQEICVQDPKVVALVDWIFGASLALFNAKKATPKLLKLEKKYNMCRRWLRCHHHFIYMVLVD